MQSAGQQDLASASDHALFHGLRDGVGLGLGESAVADSSVQPGFQGGRALCLGGSADFLQGCRDLRFLDAQRTAPQPVVSASRAGTGETRAKSRWI